MFPTRHLDFTTEWGRLCGGNTNCAWCAHRGSLDKYRYYRILWLSPRDKISQSRVLWLVPNVLLILKKLSPCDNYRPATIFWQVHDSNPHICTQNLEKFLIIEIQFLMAACYPLPKQTTLTCQKKQRCCLRHDTCLMNMWFNLSWYMPYEQVVWAATLIPGCRHHDMR